MMGSGRRGTPRVSEGMFFPRAYWFVDRSLLGVRNEMIGNSHHTRGGSAHT